MVRNVQSPIFSQRTFVQKSWGRRGGGGGGAVFFFPVTIFVLPLTFLEKVAVTLVKCLWQILKVYFWNSKNRAFSCQRPKSSRDIFKLPVTIFQKVPVKTEKCTWQISEKTVSRALWGVTGKKHWGGGGGASSPTKHQRVDKNKIWN